MFRRAWILPLVLSLVSTACGDWVPRAKKKLRKKRRKTRHLSKEERSEKRKTDGANTAVKISPDAPIERKGDVPADAPNILLVSIDTLRADALKPYGSRLDNADALTGLAREGTVFLRSWSQAPSTSPTHASMFTSALPSEHGLMGTNGRLPLSWYTLPEHMQAYGVRTWAATSSVRFALGVQLQQGFDEYAVYSSGDQHVKTNKAMEVALAAIAKEPDRPWFGFVHLMDVHAPYSVPEPHQSRFLEGTSVVAPEHTVRFLHKNRLSKDRVTPKQLADLKAMYAGGVSHVDTRIAALRAAVETLERPTILVVTADHGEAFFEKNYLGHGTFVHESIMRVPLIFWGPGLVPSGQYRSTLSQSIDLYPTLSALMGLPVPADLGGADLTPVLRGDGELLQRTVVSQTTKRQMMVRDTPDGLFKVTMSKKNRTPRMYDLTVDPLEQNNLAKHDPDKAREWAAELRDIRFSRQVQQAETWEMTDEEREALEAIGYMDADD